MIIFYLISKYISDPLRIIHFFIREINGYKDLCLLIVIVFSCVEFFNYNTLYKYEMR